MFRHAEKTGDKNDPHLSRAGAERAAKLADYIAKTFGLPDFLFAAKSSKKSRRPAETLEPLAAATGLAIREDFDDEETAELVEALGSDAFTAGKSGVISWRHSDIPRLLADLGASDGTFPPAWDPEVYNIMFEMTFREDSAPRVRRIEMPF